MATPRELEREHTLRTAVERFDDLRLRHSLADPDQPGLARAEILEVLALAQVISTKVGYGRELAVRDARTLGASQSHIGQALGVTRQSAFEAHARWLDSQAGPPQSGHQGLDDAELRHRRIMAGRADEGD